MFFMMGITPGRKEINHDQMVICDRCGKYGRYQVFVTYTVLSLFFIPVFKWGKQYYVQTTCCETTYRLNPEVGRRIEHGEQIEIQKDDMEPIGNWIETRVKQCEVCGFRTEEDFDFCPKCGNRL